LNKSKCAVIMTEWDDFKNLNFIKISKLMTSNIILDMRNIIDTGNKNLSDFKYYSLGS
jgi:UDPglucose 6-dehydrogenase